MKEEKHRLGFFLGGCYKSRCTNVPYYQIVTHIPLRLLIILIIFYHVYLEEKLQ